MFTTKSTKVPASAEAMAGKHRGYEDWVGVGAHPYEAEGERKKVKIAKRTQVYSSRRGKLFRTKPKTNPSFRGRKACFGALEGSKCMVLAVLERQFGHGAS
jgi:hypothetical protein